MIATIREMVIITALALTVGAMAGSFGVLVILTGILVFQG